MDFFSVVSKRHCYRDVFLDEPIPEEHIRMILNAALDAPSGCNLQTTRFIVILEKKLIADMAYILEKERLKTAQAMILFTCETGSTYTIEDCSAAVENALLALTALGYASCWYDGALRHGDRAKRIMNLLSILSPNMPRVLIPIGKPANEIIPPVKKAFHERVSKNNFSVPYNL